jgi:hypothetical protein
VYSFNEGQSPDAIQEDFPSLKRAQIYGVIAFYLDHQAEIDKYLEETEREFEGCGILVIVRAVRRLEPAIDFASAQEACLHGLGDPELLERAAAEGRVLVSHDRRTMLKHFRDHLGAGKTSPGLLVVSQGA